MTETLTFDCYGTLIDWEKGIAEAFQFEASHDGVDLEPEKLIETYMAEETAVELASYKPYREVLAETALRVASKLGWNLPPGRADFLSESLPGWTPFPDANPALERLQHRFRLGLLSNVDDDLLEATLRHFHVPFELIVTASQVKSYKPRVGHFIEAQRRAGSSRLYHAAQSYYHDIVPCHAMGIGSFWINRKDEELPGEAEPTVEVPNLAELADAMGV
ncbi:MAG: HAD hydrolase-like protein [Acidobacteria bacterium]|nr:HAD hydrolase-like protein [Acidobacteriota bacterium]